jgi:hypothetical protein
MVIEKRRDRMKKIITYGTVTARDETELAGAVNRYIQEGYQPFGSPVYLSNVKTVEGIPVMYLQAMVRYEETDRI